jgi:protein-arginine deiminase
MIVNHHLQNAEYVWAVGANSNQSMISTIASVVGDRFILVNSPDVWIQDELEWALATAPGKRLNVAVDSIRDRPLDAYVKGLRAPDVEPMTWGNPAQETTEDKFGNLEVTPPHTAGGVDYPLGRIYYGAGATCSPHVEVKEHLARQKVQKPIEVDTCWLCVGHVDEYISFIPTPGTDKGFKLLIADVDAAYAILDDLPAGTSLPRYADTHGYATIGEIVGDNTLRALNQDIQADRIDPVREQLMAELDLDESDVLRIPAIFERIWGCSYKDGTAVAAMIPGMLNLTVVNFEGEALRIFVSDPFMRSDTGDQSGDPLIANFKAALPPDYEIHFVDDWYTYHVAIGEVHCGTNVARSPSGEWWTDARHLFTEP